MTFDATGPLRPDIWLIDAQFVELRKFQIAMMRGDLVSIQDMNDAVVAVCRVVVDGMNEFEARASAEYPTEPRMVQVAEGITDRIKRHMQRKIEDA